MADGKFTKTTDDGSYSPQEIKELITRGKAFRFVGETIAKSYETPEGEYYIEAVASSDQEDLVGDIMSQKALRAMEVGFVGKTVFMNHRTNVPDDVFGSVVSASIQKSDGVQLLIFKIVVEKENQAAMKTWRIIDGGRVKLGTSVTVLVRNHKPNPNRKGGIIIDDVETIEHSIVGVPCNRESHAIAATATKALKLANLITEDDLMKTEKSAPAAEAAEETAETAETATVEQTAADPAAETVAADPGASTAADPGAGVAEEAEVSGTAAEPADDAAEAAVAETKTFLPRAQAAFARFKAMVEEVTASGTAKKGDEIPAVDAKGMFADRVEHPTFWDLVDILFDCYYNLRYRAWNIKDDGDTDFSEVIAAWSECLDEFKTAAVDSFEFWHASAEDDTSKALSVEEARQLEATVKHVAELIGTVAGTEKADELREIGKSVMEVAEKAGIPFTAKAPDANTVEATVTMDVTKTKEFEEVATRAETAEARIKELEEELSGAKDDLEVTKAGLAVAVEATNAALRQPLPVQRPRN